MSSRTFKAVSRIGVIVCMVLMTLMLAMPVGANPPAPDDTRPSAVVPVEQPVGRIVAPKGIDQPNTLDYWRIRERQRLLEAGQTARA